MFRCFHGSSADDVWLDVATAFRSTRVRAQPSRAGGTREIFHAALSIENPRDRWVVSRSPPINPAFALAEVVWILAGRNDSGFLTFFNRQLPSYCGTDAQLHGAYGFRLRRHFGFDQLERAARALEANPDSRQVALQLWDGTVDLPLEDGQPRAADIPCNILTLLKVRSGRLELTEILRSNDVFRGLPYNFVQFTTIQEVLAGWMGIDVGTYGQVVDSLHVYEDALADVTTSKRIPRQRNADDLAQPKYVADHAWGELAKLVDRLITQTHTERTFALAASELDVPVAYRNIAAVLCAEGARRGRYVQAAADIMAGCSNPMLQQLWTRWASRFGEDARPQRISAVRPEALR
jgi:thymidylate synthase